MSKCGSCGKFLSGGAVCTKCKSCYHKQCASLSSNQTPKNWLCPGCVGNEPRKDTTNTPVKEIAEQEEECSPSLNSGSCDGQLSVLNELRALRSDMNGFRKDFSIFKNEVRDELKDLKSMYQACTNKMDAFSVRLDSQDSRLKKFETTTVKQTQDLQIQIQGLKQELNFRDQLSLLNDIEIGGVTENSGENVMHITGLIMNKIGLSMDERDIVDARRVGPARVDTDGKQRPRPIVLRVTRRAVRDQVIRAARARRNITTSDVAVAGTPRPIYVNERLTKDTRLLFGQARTLCKQHNWKFAWTSEGRILIREGENKRAFRIRYEEDFDKVFKSGASPSISK